MSPAAAPRQAMRIVVAGLGSEYRGDDAAGPAIASRVAELCADAVDVGPVADPLDLLGLWDGVDLAIVADAARSGADPGTILLTDLGGGDAPSGQAAHASATSTHGIGLVGVLRLARVVGQAPKRVVAVSVEGADFAQGSGFSPGVAEALDAAASRAVEMIEEIRRRS